MRLASGLLQCLVSLPDSTLGLQLVAAVLHLALRLIVSVLRASAATAAQQDELYEAVGRRVLPKAVGLAASPLLQGLALRSLLALFATLVRFDASPAGMHICVFQNCFISLPNFF